MANKIGLDDSVIYRQDKEGRIILGFDLEACKVSKKGNKIVANAFWQTLDNVDVPEGHELVINLVAIVKPIQDKKPKKPVKKLVVPEWQ